MKGYARVAGKRNGDEYAVMRAQKGTEGTEIDDCKTTRAVET